MPEDNCEVVLVVRFELLPDEVREDRDARLGVVEELGVGVFLLEVRPAHEGHLRATLGLDAMHQIRVAMRTLTINGRGLRLSLRLCLRRALLLL